MKKILVMLLVLAMVFSLVACGGNNNEPNNAPNNAVVNTENEPANTGDTGNTEEPADTTPAEPKVLNLLESSNIPSLTTWQATDSVSFLILGNIGSGLYTLGEGGVPVADIAESVDISADGLTYTFKLKDADWSTVDGEVYAPVTANDFVFAWKKLLDPAEASQYSFMISTASIKNGKEAVALNEELIGYEADVENLETMDPANYEDTDEKTAKQQYDEAKAALEEKIAAEEASLTETYGSIDAAYTALSDLRDGLGVTAVDDHTLVVELSNPVPYFIDLMTFPSFFPANEAFYNEVGDSYAKSNDAFLYNGAFIFKEWKISERHYLTKNPNYWDAENVALDAIDFRVIEGVSNDTAVQMYLDGEIATTALSGENVEKYGNRPDMVPLEDVVLFYLEINQGKGEMTTTKQLLSDVRARKAINMAIDKTYITDVIYANGSLPADYFVPKGFVGSAAHDNKDWRQVAEDMYGGGEGYNHYNPEMAAELFGAAMADLGVSEVEFELIIYQGDTAAQVGTHIQNELEKNLPGVTVIVQALPFSEKLKRSDEGTYTLNWGGWGPDYPDAMTWMDMWVTGGGHNSTGYANADYDAVIEATKSGDLTAPEKSGERFEALVTLEKKLLEEDQVIVPLYQRSGVGLRDPRIMNWFRQSFGPDIIYKWVDLAQ
ncbi:MAG: peptide ABC transporter substrate-binding protein [Clostridia bacterium]|nr:peptide ABC transporter substrate-binding protein [Clostridia bacterium]